MTKQQRYKIIWKLGIFTHINIAGIYIIWPCVSIYIREFNTIIIICSKKRNINKWNNEKSNSLNIWKSHSQWLRTRKDVNITVFILVKGFSSILDRKLAEHPWNALKDIKILWVQEDSRKIIFPLPLVILSKRNILKRISFMLISKLCRVIEINIVRNYAKKKKKTNPKKWMLGWPLGE